MPKCDYCGDKIKKSEATYIEGRPYCEGCVSEAEIYSDNGEDDYYYDGGPCYKMWFVPIAHRSYG